MPLLNKVMNNAHQSASRQRGRECDFLANTFALIVGRKGQLCSFPCRFGPAKVADRAAQSVPGVAEERRTRTTAQFLPKIHLADQFEVCLRYMRLKGGCQGFSPLAPACKTPSGHQLRSGNSIPSITLLRLLPCTSCAMEIVTPPFSAFSMTKLNAFRFGSS